MKTKTALLALLAALAAASPVLADGWRGRSPDREPRWNPSPDRHDARDRWDRDARHDWRTDRGREERRRWVRCEERDGRPPWHRGRPHDRRWVSVRPAPVAHLWPVPFVGPGEVVETLLRGTLGLGMDVADRLRVGVLLEVTPTREVARWQNADTRVRYEVEPTATYEVGGGRYCREFRTRALIGGEWQEAYRTAYRQPDGTWEVVR